MLNFNIKVSHNRSVRVNKRTKPLFKQQHYSIDLTLFMNKYRFINVYKTNNKNLQFQRYVNCFFCKKTTLIHRKLLTLYFLNDQKKTSIKN